jgi:hypothetical protein
MLCTSDHERIKVNKKFYRLVSKVLNRGTKQKEECRLRIKDLFTLEEKCIYKNLVRELMLCTSDHEREKVNKKFYCLLSNVLKRENKGEIKNG